MKNTLINFPLISGKFFKLRDIPSNELFILLFSSKVYAYVNNLWKYLKYVDN